MGVTGSNKGVSGKSNDLGPIFPVKRVIFPDIFTEKIPSPTKAPQQIIASYKAKSGLTLGTNRLVNPGD
ncbi:MAG: hypothetical protein ACFFD2_21260 [Promethearchaeota archaeon]